MNYKRWTWIGLIFLAVCGAWTQWIASRRAYLQDINQAIHAYLTGDFTSAEADVDRALEHRPYGSEAKQLLVKILVDHSFAQYHAKDFDGARQTIERASSRLAPNDPAQASLASIRSQLALPDDTRPKNMEQVLDDLYHQLPQTTRPESLAAMMQRWLDRSQHNQEVALQRFWDGQEQWLARLQGEQNHFQWVMYGGLITFGAIGLALLFVFVRLLRQYFGHHGVVSQLLDAHFQRLAAVLPPGSQVLLGPPVNLNHVMESRRMDVIEAELVSGRDSDILTDELEAMMRGEDPWVRARAAKILYRVDPKAAMKELEGLTTHSSANAQTSGLWALTELATADALDLIAPLAYSATREIQQGTIRSLLQLQAKADLPNHVKQKLDQLLPEIRSKTGWVF